MAGNKGNVDYNTISAASGYNALSKTPLGGGVIWAGTIKDRNWEEDFLPEVCNTSALDDLISCGQQITFNRPAKVGAWRNYEKNQELIPDQVSPDSFCITICESAYKALKFDRLDIKQACENWDDFETQFLEDAWRELSDLWHTSALTGILLSASSRNAGNGAGRYKNINLGSSASPIRLSPENIVTYISQLKEVMAHGGRWYPGSMFMLVPMSFETLILQTMYNKQWCCDTDESVLIKGLKAENLQGFKIIETDRLEPIVDPDSGELIYTILFGWEDGYAFSGDIAEAELAPAAGNNFGVIYKMLSVHGGGVVYPESLGKSVVTFSTEGPALSQSTQPIPVG